MASGAAIVPTNRAFGMSIALAILLIIFGFLAIALPTLSSIGIVLTLGWLLLFGGVMQIVHAFQSKGVGHIVWKLLIAACYLLTGFWLLARPLAGTTGLTLVLAVFFFFQGVVEIISYASLHKAGISGWMLANGIITLLLGLLIWKHWPAASLWVIGTLTGVGMLMWGMTHLFMALTVRRLIKDQGNRPTQERWAA